jgi:hypothetical protein
MPARLHSRGDKKLIDDNYFGRRHEMAVDLPFEGTLE